MKRVLIIGCPGAGKSTFARKLAKKTELPLYYLDMIWHRPDRTTLTEEEFDRQLRKILTTDSWIIDGNYIRTLPMRLNEADTVFLFDLPVDICLAGAIDRLGQERVDMPWHDTKLDEDFRQWLLNFPFECLPVINQVLSLYTGTLHRFTSRQQADSFIEQMGCTKCTNIS